MTDPKEHLRGPWRWAHIIWALFAGSVCVLLIAAGGGHPPPIVFVPIVVVVWVMVHLALWGARGLAVRGRVRTSAAGGEKQSWPPELIVILVATVIASFLGLLQLTVTLLLGQSWPFRGALWTIMMIVWLAHAVCFVGLLLRRLWARWVAAMLCVGWALWITWEVLEPVIHGYVQPMQLMIAFGVVAVLVLASYRLLRSKRIRAFLAA